MGEGGARRRTKTSGPARSCGRFHRIFSCADGVSGLYWKSTTQPVKQRGRNVIVNDAVKTAGPRYALLDELRGLALISMIGYHAMWDLVYMFGLYAPWYGGTLPGRSPFVSCSPAAAAPGSCSNR